MKRSKKQRLKKGLDRLIQNIAKQTYDECLVCSNKIFCGHHYIQKKQSLYLRWDMRNIVPLCNHCHALHHISGDPRIHQIIIRRKGHKWADELEKDRRIILKDTIINLLDIKERLNG